MKRTILFVFALLLLAGVRAQVKVGLEVGGGINGIISDDVYNSTDMMERAGVTVDFFPKKRSGLMYETGIYYVYKGYNMSGFLSDRTAIKELRTKMNCLEVPFMFGHVTQIGNESSQARFIFKGGVYLNCGINGKGTAVWEPTGESNEERISNVFKDQSFQNGQFVGYNRFDFGIRLGSEFQIKDYFLRVSYSAGFLKVHSSYGKAMNSDLCITLGCYLL